jgi:hypothetical protein
MGPLFVGKPSVESELLFGDDLVDKVKLLNQSSGLKLAKKEPPGRGSYRGRGYGWNFHHQGRGCGFRPYGYGYHSYGYDQGMLDMNNAFVSINVPQAYEIQANTHNMANLSLSRAGPTWQERPGPEETEETGLSSETSLVDPQVSGFCVKWETFQAGRISEQYKQWQNLTTDRLLLKDVQSYTIEFDERPYQKWPERPLRFSLKEMEFARTEIANLLTKGVLQVAQHEANEFVSNVFLRPKKEQGKYRMILNLKKLNEFVTYHHFKMDTLETVLNLIRPGMFMASIDFTDAYYSLAVAEHHRKYLRFEFDDVLYQFTCLPNGLSSGPRVFTKILKVPLAWLRESFGVTISGYIDDTILCAETASQLRSDLRLAAELFQDLGFMISWKKSVLEPTQEIEFLGFLINSVTGRVSLPVGKADNIARMVRKAQGQVWFTIREVAQLLGVLVATSPGNRWAQLYTRALDIDKTEALRANYGNYEAYMSVSPIVYEDLKWWKTNIHGVFSELWGGGAGHGNPHGCQRAWLGGIYPSHR